MNNFSGKSRISVIGGGTGSSVILRGLKEHSELLSAIITVADDGGSSGILRRELGVIPPGDFRNCVAALSDSENLLKQIFDYRFEHGKGLKGHSLGNLLITAMSDITGSFEGGLDLSAKILGAKGKVFPSSLDNITLEAILDDGTKILGESLIPLKKGKISEIKLIPSDALGSESAKNALKNSDMIIVGPGSLYTSIIPPLLVKDLIEIIQSSKSLKIYVCNIATQKGESDNYSVGDHIEAIEQHTYINIFDYIIVDQSYNLPITSHDEERVKLSEIDLKNPKIMQFDIKSDEHSMRHDSKKLSNSIIKLYNLWVKSINNKLED